MNLRADNGISLMAHLLRRAGFGATREQLEAYAVQGYEATIEHLLHPEQFLPADEYVLGRYDPYALQPGENAPGGNLWWLYHMINTQRVLEEKMTLAWHQLFATGVAKLGPYDEMLAQITLFRRHALGNYGDLLLALAKSPAMIFWLDGQENHKYAGNENWGREMLERFSMGVGNYDENDVREAARAFTGWSLRPKLPKWPNGRFLWEFAFNPADHDYGSKTFLGHTGCFNGEDIIDIILQQPAMARFISRYLYSFFVADEPPIQAWASTPPRDEVAIDYLAEVFTRSRYELRPVLRALFNADFFKNARFLRIKSPAELVAGTLRLVGGLPTVGAHALIGCTDEEVELAMQPKNMGQDLMNPASVEGWNGGKEWISSAALMMRINFLTPMIGDLNRPGVRALIDRIRATGAIGAEELVDTCLDLLGPLEVAPSTRDELIEQAKEMTSLSWDTHDESQASAHKVIELLQIIVSMREYQLA